MDRSQYFDDVNHSDLLTTANNTIATANNILTHTDTYLMIVLGLLAVCVTVSVTVLQIYFNKDRNKLIKESSEYLVDALKNNQAISTIFLQKLLESDLLEKRFNDFINDNLNKRSTNKLLQVKIDEAINQSIKDTFSRPNEDTKHEQ